MTTASQNLRKAAIVVAALDGPAADAILDPLSQEQATQIRRMVVELGEIDAAERDAVLDEFLRSAPRGCADRLAAANDADVCELNGELDGGETRPFGFLHGAAVEKLATLLAGEHPQTIAVVVSHLPPDRGAALLGTLDGTVQTEVLRRLVDLGDSDPAVLREVERGLESRALEQFQHRRRHQAGLEAVAGIVAAAEPPLRRELLANLAHHDPHLVGRLRPTECALTDLERMDRLALATLLSAVDRELIVLALSGAPLRLVDHVLGSLPTRQAEQLRRAMDQLGPTRLADIDEAQRRLAEAATWLVSEGQIEFSH